MKGKFATSFSRLHVTRTKLSPARKEKNHRTAIDLGGGREGNTNNDPPPLDLLRIAFSPPLLFPPNRLTLFVKAPLVRAFFSPFVFLQPRVLAVTHHAFSFFFRPVPKDLPSFSRPLAIKSRKETFFGGGLSPTSDGKNLPPPLLLTQSEKAYIHLSTSHWPSPLSPPPPPPPPWSDPESGRRRRRLRYPSNSTNIEILEHSSNYPRYV